MLYLQLPETSAGRASYLSFTPDELARLVSVGFLEVPMHVTDSGVPGQALFVNLVPDTDADAMMVFDILNEAGLPVADLVDVDYYDEGERLDSGGGGG